MNCSTDLIFTHLKQSYNIQLLLVINSDSQVNTNGHLTFQSGFLAWTPQRFPIVGLPLIAPFWDDVDIRQFGTIFYRQTSNTTLRQRVRDELQDLFPSAGNFTPTILLIATWDRVAGYLQGLQVSKLTNTSIYFVL